MFLIENKITFLNRLLHPYFDEIEAFEPDESLLKEVTPQIPKPVDEKKYLFVDTPEKLQTMINHIELQSELAIDLEVKFDFRNVLIEIFL